METPLSREEIETILDYHFPSALTLGIKYEDSKQSEVRKQFEREINKEWAGEREVAIQRCVEDINRRITERIREF